MTTPKLVEHFFRHEFGRLVAMLSRRVGVQHIEAVEDAVQSALMKALEAWTITDATLQELSLINDMNIDSYSEGRGQQARAVKRFKINCGDPKAALDSLARILGAFNDNMTIKGELSMVERLHAGRARVKRENG